MNNCSNCNSGVRTLILFLDSAVRDEVIIEIEERLTNKLGRQVIVLDSKFKDKVTTL